MTRSTLLLFMLAMPTIGLRSASCRAEEKGQTLIWIEGEQPFDTSFPKRTWFSPKGDEAAKLSGGNWLTHSDDARAPGAPPAFATYRFNCPEAGRYSVWCRKLWRHGPFRWRIDDQPWNEVGRDVNLLDSVVIRKHIPANWISMEPVELDAGMHLLRIELTVAPGESQTAGFDAFALSKGLFFPNGQYKPGEKTGLAEPGHYAYEPDIDSFAEHAAFDLRRLNEDQAGAKGYVRAVDDHLELADGTPTRFWGVNVNANVAGADDTSLNYMSRKLAKFGVNLVRYHAPLWSEQADATKLDAGRLRDLHRLIVSNKAQGIYTGISFYFPVHMNVRPEYNVGEYRLMENKHPLAMLFLDESFQQRHRGWLKELLTTPMPSTGQPLAKEPAVAYIEIINEDSLLFFTLDESNVPKKTWDSLERRYGQWLVKRYGSIRDAVNAWGGAQYPHDVNDPPRARILPAWKFLPKSLKQTDKARRKRLRDQAIFLATVQRDFYADTVRYLHEDLGYQGMVVTGNWKTASPDVLDDAERWSYLPGDLIDAHHYFHVKVTGEASVYDVRVGHRWIDRAAVLAPEDAPFIQPTIVGKPQIISELNWDNPNKFHNEAAPLTAAYSALQGLDAACFFAVGSPLLADRHMIKFQIGSPSIIGAFPASALMYRRGDVSQPEPIMVRAVGPDAPVHIPPQPIDPLSMLVGPVQIDYRKQAKPHEQNLVPFIDRDAKIIRSANGQLAWDHKLGWVRINTPRCQGAVGFLEQAGKVTCDDLMLQTTNPFTAVLVIALDDQPIAKSRRLLVQSVTRDKPYGFTHDVGQITDMGGWPFNLEQNQTAVRLNHWGDGEVQVTPLDANGYPDGAPLPTKTFDSGQIIFPLSANHLYHLVTR
ncbi:hypothetical protein HED60_22235 [Planctomycetales bacterium ZRK34]|nr:hypothetical protein HED60_22235 [Planctomycetales bacterium ZRK34]